MMIYLIKKEHQSPQSVDENGNTQLYWVCYTDEEEFLNLSLNSDVIIFDTDDEKKSIKMNLHK